jgi:hypothetical protein
VNDDKGIKIIRNNLTASARQLIKFKIVSYTHIPRLFSSLTLPLTPSLKAKGGSNIIVNQ